MDPNTTSFSVWVQFNTLKTMFKNDPSEALYLAEETLEHDVFMLWLDAIMPD